MAFTQSSLVNILFKKYITGKSQVSDSKQYFEEPINSRPNTFNSDIWLQSDQIPSVAATVSGVTTFVSVTMTYSSGTPGGFYDSTNTLVDIIPFNYGNGTSYQYGIFRNDGTTPIALGECDWLLDPNSGVLTFYTGASSGTVINPSTLATIASPSLPPVVKAWKYVGLKSVIPNLYGLTYSGGTMSISPSLFGTGLTYSGGVLSTTITAVAGNGLTSSGNTFSVLLQSNSGLTVSSSGLALNPTSIGSGLTFSGNILSTLLQTNSGLTVSSSGLSLNASSIGSGLTFSGGILSNTAISTAGVGLTFSGNTHSVLLQTNSGLTVSSSGLSLNPTSVGAGLTFSSGVLSNTAISTAGVGLTFSGNTHSVLLQTNSGLTVSSSGLALNPSSVGAGLTFSSGILSTTIQMYGSTYTFTAGTPQTFTHSLNSTDFIIQMYDTATGDEVMAQYSNRTINTVVITVFDVVTARVVIIG